MDKLKLQIDFYKSKYTFHNTFAGVSILVGSICLLDRSHENYYYGI